MRSKHRRGAGLLPAAVEEIKRLRAEWAALKDSDLLEVSLATIHNTADTFSHPSEDCRTRKRSAIKRRSCEVLRGVVALVEVGTEPRALPLRAVLSALGATVVPLWSPLVTHVVWSEGGDRAARAQARASAAHVVSPLWVEACAAANRRVPEKTFPAAARPSDLPSPSTLLRLLKRAEINNVPLADLLDENNKKSRNMSKPVSTVTSRKVASESDDSQNATATSRETSNTSHDTSNTSHDTSNKSRDTSNTSHDTSGEKTVKGNNKASTSTADSSATVPGKSILKTVSALSIILEESSYSTGIDNDMETRVNTIPRRALPRSCSPDAAPKPEKALRKLFTQREVEPDTSDSDSDTEPARNANTSLSTRLTQRDRAGLARAERIARRMVQPGPSRVNTQATVFRTNQTSSVAGKMAGPAPAPGRLPTAVPGVIGPRPAPAGSVAATTRRRAPSLDHIYSRDGRIRLVLTGMGRLERQRVHNAAKRLGAKLQHKVNFRTTHVVIGTFGKGDDQDDDAEPASSGVAGGAGVGTGGEEAGSLRTLNSLAGAARGCRIVFAQWVLDSERASVWLSYRNYSVPYLRNIAEKAFLERRAFNMMHREYAYNVFHSRRVRLVTSPRERHAAEHLLALCGAVVVDDAGRIIHNAELEEHPRPEFDIHLDGNPATSVNNPTHSGDLNAGLFQKKLGLERPGEVVIGEGPGLVCARWVFDSVAAGRMRSTRRYTAPPAPA